MAETYAENKRGSRTIPMEGKKFFMLSVLRYSHYKNERTFWEVICDCGKQKVVDGAELRRGSLKSCGCIKAILGLKRRKIKPIKSIKEPKGKIVSCHQCNIKFYLSNCFIKERNYCSRKCLHQSLYDRVQLNCQICHKSYHVTSAYYKARGSKTCSLKCKRLWHSKNQSGDKSHLWKGGISYTAKRVRKGIDWKIWRESVFKRDNYTCQNCGIRSGKGVKVELHPHHIKQYSLYPELRFDVNNGQTLCKECHKKTDSYLNPHANKITNA